MLRRFFSVFQLLALASLASATSTRRPSRYPTVAPTTAPTEVYGVSLASVAPAASFSMFSSPFNGASKWTYGAMTAPPAEFMTVSLWIKTTEAIGRLVQVGRGSSGTLDGEWSLMVYNGKLHYSEYGGGAPAAGIVLWSRSLVNTNEYVHVVVVKNGKTGKMYVNGVLEKTKWTPVLSIAQNTIVNIGNDAFHDNQFFTGTMDQLMIYNEAFTDEQVRAMYFSSKVFQTCLPISNTLVASSPVLSSFAEHMAYFLNHASFDGSNKIYHPTLARAPTTEMTLTFWLRTTATTETVLVSFGRTAEDSSGGQFVLKLLADGKLSYTEKNGGVDGTGVSFTGFMQYNIGKWVLVTLVKNGDSVTTYRYGDVDATATVTPSTTYTNTGFSVGADVDGSLALVGEMSNLVYYLQPFEQINVRELYYNSAKLSCHLNTSPVCDYNWCCETITQYRNNNWAYNTDDFHTCTNCPAFVSPNGPEQCP
eukprot:gene30153-36425_t